MRRGRTSPLSTSASASSVPCAKTDIQPRSIGASRPRSSIAPTFIFDAQGRLRWALGATGAGWITPTVVELTVDLVDWGLAPQAAVDRGRFMPSNTRGGIALEPALYDGQPALVEALDDLDQTTSRASGPQAAAQVVGRDPATGQFVGGADQRRDGAVVAAGSPTAAGRP